MPPKVKLGHVASVSPEVMCVTTTMGKGGRGGDGNGAGWEERREERREEGISRSHLDRKTDGEEFKLYYRAAVHRTDMASREGRKGERECGDARHVFALLAPLLLVIPFSHRHSIKADRTRRQLAYY